MIRPIIGAAFNTIARVYDRGIRCFTANARKVLQEHNQESHKQHQIRFNLNTFFLKA